MLEFMEKRYSVKRFDPQKKLSREEVEELIECFRLTPSSLNLQAWKLVVVGEEELKNRLSQAGRDENSQRIRECSHLFILMRKKLSSAHFSQVIRSTEMLQLLMKKRKLSESKLKIFFWTYSLLKGPKVWATNQLYIALGVLMSACAKMGIGALPMEGIYPKKMDRLLGLSSEYKTVVALAVGHPHERDRTNPSRLKKSRLDKEDVVTTFF